MNEKLLVWPHALIEGISNQKILKLRHIMKTTKKIRTLSLLVTMFLLVPSTSFSININSTSIKGLAEAYGFMLGQEFTLSRITEEFPELSMDMNLTNASFNSTFPTIKKNLETNLTEAVGEEMFGEWESEWEENIQDTLGKQQLTKQLAIEYLAKVKRRSKGEIESPILEYMLAVQYESHPVDEFLEGFRQRYETTGDGKSQGIKLKLQLPLSWAQKDGERPHIVKKWVSQNGTGADVMLLDIRDTGDYTPTDDEVEELVSSDGVREMVPSGAEYIDSGLFSLEMRKGYWLEMSMNQNRAGIRAYQHFGMYQLFFRGKAIGLSCQTMSPAKDKAKAVNAYKKIKPLCQQVLNSMVLLQAY